MADNNRFIIPDRDEDLLVESRHSYYVSEEYSAEEAASSVTEYSEGLNREGWGCLPSLFDYLFAVVRRGSVVEDLKVHLRLAALIRKGLRLQIDELSVHLTEACEPQIPQEIVDESARHSDCLLMSLYLLGRLNSHIEAEYVKRQKDSADKKVKGKKGGKMEIETSDVLSKWSPLREDILEVLLDICELEAVGKDGRRVRNAVRFLWRPTVVNSSMIKMITRMLLDWIDSPEHKMKSSGWLTQIFRLLVPLCMAYNQHTVLGALLLEKTIHLEYTRDCYPFIEAIQRQNKDSRSPDIQGEVEGKRILDPLLTGMLAQVAMLNASELGSSANSSRPLVQFIQTISFRAPHLMMRQISSFMRFLSEDPYQLRSAVLTAMADVIASNEMCKQVIETDSIRLEARNKMLAILQEHLRDQSTQVRAKVVSLWKMLAEAERIPIKVLDDGLLDDMAARLEDKLVSVRKPAIAFMTIFLRKNPYGHDFTFDMNVERLQKMLEEREELKRRNPEHTAQMEAIEWFRGNTKDFRKELKAEIAQYHRDHDLSGAEKYDTEIMDFCCDIVVEKPRMVAVSFTAFVFANVIPTINPKGLSDLEIEDKLVDLIENYYVLKNVKKKLQNEDWQLLNEEKIADHEAAMEKMERGITWLKGKVHMEMGLAQTLQSALRGALQGDSAELKEAINFIIQCKNFMIRGADDVVRNVFALIWRNNVDIQKEVIAAAKQMLVSTNIAQNVANQSTAENMLAVLEGVNEVEQRCVEEVVTRMVASSDYNIPDGVVTYVNNIINRDNHHPTPKRKKALKLMTIISKTGPDRVRPFLRQYQSIIVNGPKELKLEALELIASMSKEPRKDGFAIDPLVSRRSAMRIPIDDSLFTNIEDFFMNEFIAKSCDHFVRLCRHTLSVYFEVGRESSVLCSKLVAKVLWTLQRAARSLQFYEAEGEKVESERKQETDNGTMVLERRTYWRELFEEMLQRTMHFAGEVAVRVFIYVDYTMVREMKKLQEVINQCEKVGKDGIIPLREIAVRPWEKWEHECAMKNSIFLNFDTHSGLTRRKAEEGSNSDDFSDFASTTLKDQFRSHNLLGRLIPLVNYCVRANGTSKGVRGMAALAFTKFIPLSQEYAGSAAFMCMLLMSASSDPQTRENLLVAMPDIYQFVSLPFDNYQSELFNMCRDTCAAVRETALLVLLYVTSDGIVQSRSGIADVARCYVDPVEDIQIMTKIFFNELSRKKSTISNAMPDFLSRLSRNPKHISLEQFKKIMTFLFDFLEDSEVEELVPRILTRMESIDAPSLERNPDLPVYTMFCLYSLARTEKAFYKIRDSFKVIEPHIHMKGVHDQLIGLLDRLKRIHGSHPDYPNEVHRFIEEVNTKHAQFASGKQAMAKAQAYQRRVKEAERLRERVKVEKGLEVLTEENEESESNGEMEEMDE